MSKNKRKTRRMKDSNEKRVAKERERLFQARYDEESDRIKRERPDYPQGNVFYLERKPLVLRVGIIGCRSKLEGGRFYRQEIDVYAIMNDKFLNTYSLIKRNNMPMYSPNASDLINYLGGKEAYSNFREYIEHTREELKKRIEKRKPKYVFLSLCDVEKEVGERIKKGLENILSGYHAGIKERLLLPRPAGAGVR
ncbi:hypothetical protein KY345_02290 [Candidatus Woesearchaeota archaeon]|nr:hypothetical protein [Candidatus Woesearchaeota archaeon]